MITNLNSLENEVWRQLKEFPGYEISNLGRVRELSGTLACRLLNPDNGVYPGVCISGKQRAIHVLVAETFLKNPNNLPLVHHKDLNKKNFKLDNLEYHSYGSHWKLHRKIVNEKKKPEVLKRREQKQNAKNLCRSIVLDLDISFFIKD